MAKLTVLPTQLSLSGWFIGRHYFRADQVVSFDTSDSIGLRIIHSRSEVPPDVIFWCWNPKKLAIRIADIGFKPVAREVGYIIVLGNIVFDEPDANDSEGT